LPDFQVEVLDAQPKTVSLGQSFGLYGWWHRPTPRAVEAI
jgi:hypothetical protein